MYEGREKALERNECRVPYTLLDTEETWLFQERSGSRLRPRSLTHELNDIGILLINNVDDIERCVMVRFCLDPKIID